MLTLNQRVQGWSPCAPTSNFNDLWAYRRNQGKFPGPLTLACHYDGAGRISSARCGIWAPGMPRRSPSEAQHDISGVAASVADGSTGDFPFSDEGADVVFGSVGVERISGRSRTRSNASLWRNSRLSSLSSITYVAMSRAKKGLELMIPRQAYRSWHGKLGDQHAFTKMTRFIPASIRELVRLSLPSGSGPVAAGRDWSSVMRP